MNKYNIQFNGIKYAVFYLGVFLKETFNPVKVILEHATVNLEHVSEEEIYSLYMDNAQ